MQSSEDSLDIFQQLNIYIYVNISVINNLQIATMYYRHRSTFSILPMNPLNLPQAVFGLKSIWIIEIYLPLGINRHILS